MKRALSLITALSTAAWIGMAIFVIYNYDAKPDLSIRVGWIACGFGIAALVSGVTLQLRFSKR